VVAGEPSLQWRKLTQDGQLTLATVQWAYLEGLLDERTALMLSPLDLQDVDEVLGQAKAERSERAASFPETQPAEQNFDADLQAQIDDLEI
jgi:adenylate cyclase